MCLTRCKARVAASSLHLHRLQATHIVYAPYDGLDTRKTRYSPAFYSTRLASGEVGRKAFSIFPRHNSVTSSVILFIHVKGYRTLTTSSRQDELLAGMATGRNAQQTPAANSASFRRPAVRSISTSLAERRTSRYSRRSSSGSQCQMASRSRGMRLAQA